MDNVQTLEMYEIQFGERFPVNKVMEQCLKNNQTDSLIEQINKAAMECIRENKKYGTNQVVKRTAKQQMEIDIELKMYEYEQKFDDVFPLAQCRLSGQRLLDSLNECIKNNTPIETEKDVVY